MVLAINCQAVDQVRLVKCVALNCKWTLYKDHPSG